MPGYAEVLADHHRWDAVVPEPGRSGGTQPVLPEKEGDRGRIYRVLLLRVGSKACPA